MAKALKVKGGVGKLETKTDDGIVIDSEIVLKPACDVFIPGKGYLAAAVMSPSELIKLYGVEVADRVFSGEIVEVEGGLQKGLEVHSCPYVPLEVSREALPVTFPSHNGNPIHGFREHLIKRPKVIKSAPSPPLQAKKGKK